MNYLAGPLSFRQGETPFYRKKGTLHPAPANLRCIATFASPFMIYIWCVTF
jgi:hypothetical protein